MAAGEGSEQRGGARPSDVLIDIARSMFEAETVDEVLQSVVDGATRAVPGCDGAAVVIARGAHLQVAAASSEAARQAEQAEADTGEGPCIQALRDHVVVSSRDLAVDDRWPAWRSRVAEGGFRSLLGYRLYAGADSFGALDLFSSRPDVFDADAEAAGLALAGHAAIALANARQEMAAAGRIEGLQNALASRDLIGQAKGILMERHRVTGDEAFDRLRVASQHTNRPLREVAADVVRTGEVPG